MSGSSSSNPAPSSPSSSSATTTATTTHHTTSPSNSSNLTTTNNINDIDLSTLSIVMHDANLAFVQRQYEHAAMLFSQVAEAYARQFGTIHPKCADVHFRYGRALLNHAIEKSGLLGDAEQLRSATGKREKDLLSLVDESLIPHKDPSRFHFGDEQPIINHPDDDVPVNDDMNSIEQATKVIDKSLDTNVIKSDHSNRNVVGGEGEDDDEEDQEEQEDEDIEEDDFEIAFEVLDVARIIYSQMLSGSLPLDTTGIPDITNDLPILATTITSTINKGKNKCIHETSSNINTIENQQLDSPDYLAVKRRYAEVISTLGDVSLESESFGQAVDDYSQSLILQQELYQPIDRRLAETHYKLALSLEYAETPDLDRALQHLQASHRVLITRRDQLILIQQQEQREQQAQQDNNNNNNNRIELEIKEINELIPELDLKIDDIKQSILLRDNPNLNVNKLSDGSNTIDTELNDTSNNNNNNTITVNDLSSLVKKKSPLTSTTATPTTMIESSSTSKSLKRKHEEEQQEKQEINDDKKEDTNDMAKEEEPKMKMTKYEKD